MAGRWQGVPARVLAPQRGAARILASRASVLWFMGLIFDFAAPFKGETKDESAYPGARNCGSRCFGNALENKNG
jgi:hypothetical protein